MSNSNATPRKKSSRTPLYVVGGLILAMIIFSVIGRKAGFLGGKKALEVSSEKSAVRTLHSRVTESGTIQPTIEVPVAPDVSGEVVNLYVREGQKVKKGDLLVTIRPEDYKTALEQAQAGLNLAKSDEMQAKASLSQAKANYLQDSLNLIRTRQLFKDNVISKVDLENAELKAGISYSQRDAAKFNVQAAGYRIRNSEASLKQSRQALDRTNIYASMDGTITLLNVEVGQRVVGTMQMMGTEILRIADLSSMELVVEVNENDIVNVHLGDSSVIEVDAFPDKKFYGKVTDMAYSAKMSGMGTSDQVTNFEVKVRIEPESYASLGYSRATSPFRPGMTGIVEIFTQKEADVVTVPIQAVTLSRTDSLKNEDDEEQEIVFVLENGIAKEVPVETGISDDTYIHIISGLDSGLLVVTGPYTVLTRQLKDGSETKELDKKTELKGRPGGD